MTQPRKIFVVGHREKPRVPAAAERLMRAVGDRVEVLGIDLDDRVDLKDVEADLVVVLGGDGALLSAVRRLDGRQTPVFGINFGKLGFLSGVRASELEEAVDQILVGGDFRLSRRMMLEATVRRRDGSTSGPHRGLNDAVVERWDARSLTVHLTVGGESATTFRGDGLIIATPTGSSAHSLAAGGPIVEPSVQAFVVCPMCTHSLTNRPLVLSPDRKLEIQIGAGSLNPGMAVDGQVMVDLEEGDVVTVERSRVTADLVMPPGRSHFDILHNRLHWAGEPPYESDG